MKNSATDIDNKAQNPSRNKPVWPVFLFAVGCIILLVLVALWWYPPLWQANYAPVDEGPFLSLPPAASVFSSGVQADDRVRINTAGWQELTVLPGIGETKAKAIVDYRQEHGPFSGPDDLLKVPGIGPKILEGLEDLLSYE